MSFRLQRLVYCPSRRFFGKIGGDPPLGALVSLSFKGEPKYTGADTPWPGPRRAESGRRGWHGGDVLGSNVGRTHPSRCSARSGRVYACCLEVSPVANVSFSTFLCFKSSFIVVWKVVLCWGKTIQWNISLTRTKGRTLKMGTECSLKFHII